MTQPESHTAHPADEPGAATAVGAGSEASSESWSSNVRQVVGRIGRNLDEGAIPAGDRAELRRIKTGDIGGPAFWRIVVRYLEPAEVMSEADTDAPWRIGDERKWSTILAGMAEMTGYHGGGRPLGRLLAESEVAEQRVLRLLQAHGDALLEQVRQVTHQLSSRGARLHWGDMAELVLSDGATRPSEGSSMSWEDAVRRRIALQYYRNRNH